MDVNVYLTVEVYYLILKMQETLSFLGEAELRYLAIENLGPINSRDGYKLLEDINFFNAELGICHKRLNRFLYLINWKGPVLPLNTNEWPMWWSNVRDVINKFEVS